jgi:hypothetical protein
MTDFSDAEIARFGAFATLITDAKACKVRIDALLDAAAQSRNAESDRTAQLDALKAETDKAQALRDEAARLQTDAANAKAANEAESLRLGQLQEVAMARDKSLLQRESDALQRENAAGARENSVSQREDEVAAKLAEAEAKVQAASDLMAQYDADKHAALKKLAGDGEAANL